MVLPPGEHKGVSVYGLTINDKNSRIMTQNPQNDPNRQQNLTTSFSSHDQPLQKVFYGSPFFLTHKQPT